MTVRTSSSVTITVEVVLMNAVKKKSAYTEYVKPVNAKNSNLPHVAPLVIAPASIRTTILSNAESALTRVRKKTVFV